MALAAAVWSCSFAPPAEEILVLGVSATSPADKVEAIVPLEGESGDGLPACQVRLYYCEHPLRHPKWPSYCSVTCSAEDALRRSYSTCKRTCGPAAYCETFWDLGPC